MNVVVPPIADLKNDLNNQSIPPHLHEGLIGYMNGGYLPGNFLCCVLENDLAGAVQRADPISIGALKPLVNFLHMCVPSCSWGSPAKVRAWSMTIQARLPNPV